MTMVFRVLVKSILQVRIGIITETAHICVLSLSTLVGVKDGLLPCIIPLKGVMFLCSASKHG